MRISYRQGLITASSGFLVNSQTPNYVDLFIDNSSIVAAIAFGDRDYLISEEESVTNAWGPLSGASVQYLFWELNPFTGVLTRGVSDYAPVNTASAPQNPPTGLMWWNTSTNKMSVWNGASWKDTYRVLAGSVVNGAIIPEPFISQVGLNTPVNAGFILTDGYGSTFRDANGNLFTTATTSFQNDTGSLVKLQESVILVQANESIPKFSFVYLLDGRAALASNSSSGDYAKAPIAMVTEDAYQNTQCQLQMFGRQVFNQDWNFSANEIGQSVYSDADGALTLVKPLTEQFVRCGIVLSSQSIYLSFDTHYATNPGAGSVTPGSLSAAEPLHILSAGQGYEISIARASTTEDGYISAVDFARIGAIESQLPNFALTTQNWPQSQVTGLPASLNGKAPTVHTHAQSDVTNLVTDLAAKAELVHVHEISGVTGLTAALNSINAGLASKVNVVPSATAGNLPAFNAGGQVVDSGVALSNVATMSTTWPISSVTNLANELSTLAPLSTIWPQSQVSGLESTIATIDAKMDKVESATFGRFAAFDSLGNVSDSGFSSSSFASSSATWSISSVTGLQSALDSKASIAHTHSINDTTGLQVALNSKLDSTASLPISQIVGLQASLNAKVGKIGDTMTGDLIAPNVLVGSTSLNADGSITVSGSKGIAGQVLTSAGSAAATWSTIPTVSAPVGQLLIGTGTGVNGTPAISYSNISGTDTISINGNLGTSGSVTGGLLSIAGYAIINGSLLVGGTFALDGDVGEPGQILQSNGSSTPSWVDLEEVSLPSRPNTEIVFGTGSGLTSDSTFTFNPGTGVVAVGSSTTITSGNINTVNYSGTAMTLSGPANINSIGTSEITIANDLTVNGHTYAADITATGNLVSATLTISGVSTFNSIGATQLDVSGNVNISGILDVLDITTDVLTAAGLVTVGELISTGDISANNILIAGDASITGDIIGTNIFATSYLEIVGSFVIDGDIGVSTGAGTEYGLPGQALVSAGAGNSPKWETLSDNYFEVDSAEIATAVDTSAPTLEVSTPFPVAPKDLVNNKSSTKVFVDGLLIREGAGKYLIVDSLGEYVIQINTSILTNTSEVTIFSRP